MHTLTQLGIGSFSIDDDDDDGSENVNFKMNSRFPKLNLYRVYSLLSLNGHLYETDISVNRTLRVGPYLSLVPLFDSLYKTDTYCRSPRCPSQKELTVFQFAENVKCRQISLELLS